MNLHVSDRTVCRRLREAIYTASSHVNDLSSALSIRKNVCNLLEGTQIQHQTFGKRFYEQMKVNSSYLGKRSGLESGENMEKSFKTYQKIVKHGGNIMIWGCFSQAGVGNLIKINGIMTTDVYIDVINENLEESLLKIGLENNFFNKIMTRNTQQRKVKLFFVPVASNSSNRPSDLNPISLPILTFLF